MFRWLRAILEGLPRLHVAVRCRPSSHLLMVLHTSLLRSHLEEVLVGETELCAWLPESEAAQLRCSSGAAFAQTVAELATDGASEILDELGRTRWTAVDGGLKGTVLFRIARPA